MKDLFKNLMRFTERKEDFFTECLAATLHEDSTLASMFLQKICGPELGGIKIANADIDIETQSRFNGSCIDMVFKLNNKIRIGVENKLWAPEGPGQLLKYLKLPLDALAFITDSYLYKVSMEALNDPRYLKPDNRDYFMWQDFYEDVSKCAEQEPQAYLTKSLLGLFEHLGFEPPHAAIGDLRDPNENIAKKNRKNFEKFWQPTRQGLRERGWKRITRGSIAELYVKEGSAKRLHGAWLDPINHRGSLKIRLNLRRGVDLSDVVKDLETSKSTLCPDMEVVITTPKGRKKDVEVEDKVIDILVPMRKLFDNLSDAESISRKLSDYTLAVFDIVG